MVRQPKSMGDDAWKRWLLGAVKLFDRTWSGWTLLFWLGSCGVVYIASEVNHLAAVALLAALSSAAFGCHVAVFDVLADGKRGPWAWLSAIGRDLATFRASYFRSALIRVCVVVSTLLALAGLIAGFVFLVSTKPDAATAPVPEPFWKLWSIWAWMWLIPAGWQKCGALGWGHWLVRREGVPLEIAEQLTRLGIGLNARSYAIVIGVMMAPSIAMMVFFPPLLPIWDVYVAAVCWCIWDDVFGEGKGLKEMEAKKVSAPVGSIVGA